jgi:SAM-dependent methyltransferase
MKIKMSPETAVYVIWQRTKYTKDSVLYRIAYRLNSQFPLLAYPFYYLLALTKRNEIERLFNEDMQVDFDSIAEHLPKNALRSLDIGAGVGGINVLLSEHYNHKIQLHLLDKSAVNKSIYYGFEDKTAFYNSLTLAHNLIAGSGVPSENITLHEVGDVKNSPFKEKAYDLITSFISWGYHYPIDTYLDDVKRSLSPEGALIVDLRVDGEELQILQRDFAEVSVIYKTPYLRRVMARKPRTV